MLMVFRKLGFDIIIKELLNKQQRILEKAMGFYI